MVYKAISLCPVCGEKLKITRLKCEKCKTIIENEFEFSKFQYLNKEQLDFVEIFVKCKGNIKDVEKELNISYPTVKARLDDVRRALGYEDAIKESNSKASNTSKNNTSEVIDDLKSGKITAQEAIDLLK